ncbi:unnamed protein product [Euphydryas editha]|uniref:Uncharacterized protein n=1 Tax=Euphydryas editha TaxID=104508 RepID=A0AAU9TGC1_EUPED|nr:unnamed protein product [Euphydryas editha]
MLSRYLFSLILIEVVFGQSITYLPRNGVTSTNIVAANQPQNIISNGQNIALARSTNGMTYNMPVAGNSIANVVSNAQINNAINENTIIANQGIANANLANANLAALNNANLANINGNMATFNLGNWLVTSGSPGNQRFGIQVVADALEVGGTVAVNGHIPIFGTVTVNGNLPTDGSATVNYNCARPVIE